MFSRRSNAGLPAQGKGGATFSFIGPEVVITGDIATPGQLHIDGKVTGDVRCGSLSQGESGAIDGNIVADEARLAGLIDGGVSAGTLLLEATARVTGDVLYETFTVATGAQVDGRFKRRAAGSEIPAKASAASRPAQPAKAAGPAQSPPGLFPAGSGGKPTETAAEAAE